MIEDAVPGSVHVREVELQTADDARVWSYAAAHELVIVSKDSDFHQMSVILGHPPKVVWIQRGNCSTSEVAQMLRSHVTAIGAFIANEEAGLLALS